MTTNKTKTADWKEIKGGVTAVQGIRASGIHCGLKTNGDLDLALVVSDAPCAAAAFFTTNQLIGAHIPAMREKLDASGDKVRAILINSRIANCSTGKAGIDANYKITAALAKQLSVPADQTLMASTGVIGLHLPVDKLTAALPKSIAELSGKGGPIAAQAIMTTDTRPKSFAIEVKEGGGSYRIAGMAKGAGMICPNMATLLVFLFTDAAVPKSLLNSVSRRVMDRTLNAISVDNDMSPNDTLLVMANGLSKVSIKAGTPAAKRFEEALLALATRISTEIVLDGEGATKLVNISIERAASDADALTIARAIAHSQLVKTALFGEDPNWGRIISAAGASTAKFDPDRATLTIGKTAVYTRGRIGKVPANLMKGKELDIRLDVNLGKASARFMTSDLSVDYVKINAEYTT